jgi:methylamine dehydrogenase accessory protein MauD
VRIGGSDVTGTSTLLFFLSPTCPVCETLLPVLHGVQRAEGPRLRVVIASDGARAEHEEFIARHRLDLETYVLSTDLGVTFQIGRVPYAVLVDAAGIVRARGLVSSREHLESLFEARERGVASLQAYVASRGRATHAGASVIDEGRGIASAGREGNR